MESMQLDWLSGVIKMPEVHKLVNIANLFLDNFQIRVRKIDKTSTEIAKEFNRAESPYSTKKYKTFIIHNTWKGVRKAGCVVPLPSCAQGRKKRGGRHPPAPFSSLSWERLFYIIERERAAIKRWSTITGRHSWTIFQVQKRLNKFGEAENIAGQYQKEDLTCVPYITGRGRRLWFYFYRQVKQKSNSYSAHITIFTRDFLSVFFALHFIYVYYSSHTFCFLFLTEWIHVYVQVDIYINICVWKFKLFSVFALLG